MTVKIMTGDCRSLLRTLPDESVHCVVTSPPYWGLRDYGVLGQIGLEDDFTAYVSAMVEVFRQVRRVLRRDGVVFLNLGDSYFGGGRGGGGSYEAERPGWRDVPCGTSDKARSNFPQRDYALKNLCDGCRVALTSVRTPHSDRLPACAQPPSLSSSNLAHRGASPDHPPTSGYVLQAAHIEGATADRPQIFEPVAVLPHGALASTIPQYERQQQDLCFHCDNCGVCLAVLGSSSRDAGLCARKTVSQPATHLTFSSKNHRTSNGDIASTAGAWRFRKTDTPFDFGSLKPKDLVGIPWAVAFALRADGWFLRQDIIWSKSNPMPESVRDRCTKAHEYLFLLSKSERYYFDQTSIAEATVYGERDCVAGAGNASRRDAVNDQRIRPKHTISVGETRNKRSVWEIATAPYSEAHFATFPPALIEPCIKAGCPVGGTVLDPFGGAGTTGLVADRLQRNAILIELNPAYAAMARRRIDGDAPLFAQAEEVA